MSVAALIGAIGQAVLKYSSISYKENGLSITVITISIFAFCLYGLVMLLFLNGLKHGRQLSTTYPIYSLTFPLASVISCFAYDETISTAQWIGFIVICGGVGLINKNFSSKKTTEEASI
jgi:drug/metabolite transporter (DMT)-like permease